MVDEALKAVAAEELARRSLLDFGQRMYRGFAQPKHIEYIAKLLERLESGEIKRLAIALPVRSGKSTICSQIFPAWFLGRNPSSNVILSSHAESLAVSFSRRSLHMVQDELWPFQDVTLSSDSSSVQRWNVKQGGGCLAVGAGSNILGKGANLLLLDDILNDGYSQPEKDKAWEWWQSRALPRLEPEGRVLVVGARLAGDDIIGRLQDQGDDNGFRYVSIPAIAGEFDVLGRAPGEALWPERQSFQELEERRQEVGSRVFACQWQQDPQPEGGLTFNAEWLSHRYKELPTRRFDQKLTDNEDTLMVFFGVKPQVTVPLTIMSIDSAWKSGAQHDRTVISTLVSDGCKIFVKDVLAGRFAYTDLKTIVAEQYKKHKPSRVYVEEASSGYALLEDLRKQTPIPVVGVVPGKDSKVARAEALSGLFESGKVLWPEKAPWLEDALNEFLRFPANRHDDIVDSVCLGIKQIVLRLQQEAETRHYQKVKEHLQSSGWLS